MGKSKDHPVVFTPSSEQELPNNFTSLVVEAIQLGRKHAAWFAGRKRPTGETVTLLEKQTLRVCARVKNVRAGHDILKASYLFAVFHEVLAEYGWQERDGSLNESRAAYLGLARSHQYLTQGLLLASVNVRRNLFVSSYELNDFGMHWRSQLRGSITQARACLLLYKVGLEVTLASPLKDASSSIDALANKPEDASLLLAINIKGNVGQHIFCQAITPQTRLEGLSRRSQEHLIACSWGMTTRTRRVVPIYLEVGAADLVAHELEYPESAVAWLRKWVTLIMDKPPSLKPTRPD